VVLPNTRTFPAEVPFVAIEAPELEYRQVIDMDPSLQAGPVYYHLRIHGENDWVQVRVDASRPRRQALVGVARDLLRPRLEWHLARAVQEGRIRPALGYVPILEKHALAKDDPLPTILVKESITPIGIPIGMNRGEWQPASPGQAFRENSYHYRAKVDLLILSENPSERTELANLVHGAILVDQPLLEDRGWRGIEVARFTDMALDPAGFPVFAEEISVDGELTFVVREEMVYSVSEMQTFFTPL
jgi:hypothetical protein